jgi:hypothetical protein
VGHGLTQSKAVAGASRSKDRRGAGSGEGSMNLCHSRKRVLLRVLLGIQRTLVK